MLKNIPPILSPDLFHVLMEMGHGDELVLADGNFPSASLARRIIRCDGQEILPLLEAILLFFPLDYRVAQAAMMEIPQGTDCLSRELVYRPLLEKSFGEKVEIVMEERDSFYNRASQAYAIVATSDTTRFSNLIIRKGVVTI
ncbi:MAG: fucose isomerase [Hungatella sp.]|jgi:L-fucose mutarotase|nr:fucose isomerase [Hungatella sp.]